MTFPTRVNRALGKVTGYQLVGSDSKPSDVKPPPSARPAQPSTGKGKSRSSAKKRKRKTALPSDYDQETREIWEAVRDRTMTHHTRVQSLIQAVRYIDRYQIPGAVVECGVWRGGSMLTVAHTLLRRGVTDRD